MTKHQELESRIIDLENWRSGVEAVLSSFPPAFVLQAMLDDIAPYIPAIQKAFAGEIAGPSVHISPEIANQLIEKMTPEEISKARDTLSYHPTDWMKFYREGLYG